MKNSFIIVGILAVIILAFIGFSSGNLSQEQRNPKESPQVQAVALNNSAPEASFTLLNNKESRLSEFKGKKVMLWFLATWCPSCIAGAQVLSDNNNNLSNLKIIALKTYGNAGYFGPSIEDFAKKNAPATLSFSNWFWGDAFPETTKVYNPKSYPDIYFLIDENGVIREINTAPSATIKQIIDFANE